MNKARISPRTIQMLIGLGAILLISASVMLYALEEPARLEVSKISQIQADLDDAMTLYAENCSVCHGLAGEGIGSIPPLDNPGLRESDSSTLYKIIARSLYDTAMPAWSREDGGPLSDYQINQVVTMIQRGDWQAAQERVVNLGLAPLIPFAAEPDTEIISGLAGLPDGEILAQGIRLYASECVACHGADGVGTSLAPALNDPAVRATPVDELERIIRYGVPNTLMAGWGNTLSEEDISAALALITLWDQVPAGAIPAPDAPVPVTEESLALGGDLFAANCSRCHGPEGQGTQRAPSLNVKGYLEEITDQALQQIVTLGVPGTAMPAWGDRMTDAEIQAIVGFIRSWEPTAPEVAEPARGGGPWWQTGDSSPVGQTGSARSGGPPWARDNGQSGGAGIQVEAPAPETNVLSENRDAIEQPSNGGTAVPPERAGQGNGSGGGQVHTGETSSGPPWAQKRDAVQWWQSLEPLEWWLVLSVGAVVILFIGTGIAGLRRLSKLDEGILGHWQTHAEQPSQAIGSTLVSEIGAGAVAAYAFQSASPAPTPPRWPLRCVTAC